MGARQGVQRLGKDRVLQKSSEQRGLWHGVCIMIYSFLFSRSSYIHFYVKTYHPSNEMYAMMKTIEWILILCLLLPHPRKSEIT